MFKPNDHIADHADSYWHELLSAADMIFVDRHCEECSACKTALKTALKRLELLEKVPPVEAPERLVRAALEHIEQTERRRRRFRRRFFTATLAAAAVAALVIGAWNIWCVRLAPTPYDLQLLGQTQLLAGAHGSLRVLLTDHQTTRPLAGVPITIELRNRRSGEAVELARFTTNDQGTGEPRFRLPDWSEDDCELRVSADVPDGPEVVAQPVRLQRQARLMLTSDKPVYQPGQTIHVRALALMKPALKPVADQPLTFSITDPKGNVVFKQALQTSKFGISAIDCPMASEILEGPYTIAAQLGDTESKLTVEVFKYVLPKFTLDVTLDKPFYAPGQVVKGAVQADYVFGSPVVKGDVEISVQTTSVAPRMLTRLTARTDEAGKAEFQYTLPDSLVGLPQQGDDGRVNFVVTVQDPAAQKQAKQAACLVTTRPVRVQVIPEGGTLVADLPNQIYLFATRANGTPVPHARLTVVILGQERNLTTNNLGVATFDFTPTGPDATFTVSTQVEGFPAVGQPFHFFCGQPADNFLVRTDKAVYDGGETVHLSILGGRKEPVFIDFLKDGQTVLTETINLANGHGEHTFDLPPEMAGPLQLSAYRFDRNGFAVRKTRVLYVRPASQVKVDAHPDRETYRPGRPAKVNFTLTDEKGRPTPGAVSLAVVDKAVFAVLDQSPGLERTFDKLEKQLLEPVYTIYPWSPFAPTGLPRDEQIQFDQALFARTAAGQQAVATRGAAPVWGAAGERPSASVQAVFPSSVYSLTKESFPEKERQVEANRTTQLSRLKVAWWVFGITFGVSFYAALVLLFRSTEVFAWSLVGALLCVGVTVVAVGQVGSNANGTFTKISTTVNTSGGAPAERQMAPLAEDRFEGRKAAAPPPPGIAPRAADGAPPPPNAEPVRVREYFPETLRWVPQLITDDAGRAVLDLELADSITTWHLATSAVTTDGRLGAANAKINVFQSFFVDLNLPRTLTRQDEIAIPVVVYNYDTKAQTVRLTLATDPQNAWFTPLEGLEKTIELKPGEVRSAGYRIRVEKVGDHELTVTARAGDLADAVKRTIEVVPDGRRIERVVNGAVETQTEVSLDVPADAIEGSPKAILKIYPSGFSQLVEGLDSIFQMPYGCFEQTSSTTYPNVLALDYLRRTHKSMPEVEAKARQYIHLGYQRLLGFEVAGGGFDWFGRPPANRTLTAYGLMEFRDMARVHDVDPRLIERTRDWLLRQRQPDGSWLAESHGMHDDPTRRQDNDAARLSTTAYIAWAVFAGPDSESSATREFLLAHRPETIDDPYLLALVCNALLAIDPKGGDAAPYLDRLEGLRQEDGKLVFWQQAPNRRTAFYGSGRSGGVETTALAVLAMAQVPGHRASAVRALGWLVKSKDGRGTWYSTQATVLALRALVAGTELRAGDDKERRLTVQLGERTLPDVVIRPDQTEVMQQIDLSAFLHTGVQTLTLRSVDGTAVSYQLAFRYHVPGMAAQAKEEPLTIRLDYDQTDLEEGQTVRAMATVTNNLKAAAPMVMLDLPIPAGFALEADDLAMAQATSRSIAKFQVLPRQVIVYLTGLQPGETLKLDYRLKATMPVKVSVPAARVYEYYDSDKQGFSAPGRFTVRDRK